MRSIGFVRMLMGLLGTGAGCAGLRRKPSPEQLAKEGKTTWLSEDRYVYVGQCEWQMAEVLTELSAWEPAALRWAARNPEKARCVSISKDGTGVLKTEELMMSRVAMSVAGQESCVTRSGHEGEMISMAVDVSAAQFFCR